MSKVVRLTENDLVRLVKKVISEQGLLGYTDYKLDPDILFPNNQMFVVKDEGKILKPNLVRNGLVGGVSVDDYDYIVTGNLGTYACQTKSGGGPSCFASIRKTVDKTENFKEAKNLILSAL
jgi:hypothetical protein